MSDWNRRQFVGAALASAGLYRTDQTPSFATSGGSPWFERLLVGIEIGPTGANDHDSLYMSAATGSKWVEALVRARAQYGVVFMKDQNFAYYNSHLARKCPNLGTRDLLRECLDAAAGHAIPVIAYCQIQYDTAAWKTNPDWRMKDQAGDDIPDRLCYNSGYFDYSCAIAAEMLAYEISGFHFDMLDFGFGPPFGCWCPHCEEAFQKQFGTSLPREIAWNQDWESMLKFRYDSNARFCARLEAFVRGKRPTASIDFNYHGYPPFSWFSAERPVQHSRQGDFVTAEGLPWIFGNHNPSLLALFMAGARPGAPVQCVTSRSVYNYHDFSVRPVADMTWEVFTYLSHGAQCTIVDKANYDGSLDPLVYERIGGIFGEAQKKYHYFGHTPLQEVGLYYSSRSRDWFGREDTEKYMAAFCGAHKALVEAHISIGMIMDENASIQRLRQFPVVYLPNVAIVTPAEVALLTEYVAGGGNLLVTGLTGLYDSHGHLQQESSLSELVGARLVECLTKHPDNYLRLPAGLGSQEGRFLLRDIPADWPMLTWAPIAAYQANGAQAFGELMIAVRSQDNSWSKHMSPGKVVGPAVFINQHGRGKTILVPCMPDAAFIQRYRMLEHRHLIRNLIRYLNPVPEVLIDAPANLETVITRDKHNGRLLIHLNCYSAPPTATSAPFGKGREVLPPVMEEAARYEGKIVLRGSFSKVSPASPNTKITIEGNRIAFSSNEIHEVIAVDS